jgi:hypothetical protein
MKGNVKNDVKTENEIVAGKKNFNAPKFHYDNELIGHYKNEWNQ